MDIEAEQALVGRLEQEKPATVLVVAREIPACVARFAGQRADTAVHHVVFESLKKSISNLGRFDFVVVCDTLEWLSRTDGEQMIARLRDIHSKLLWVLVPSSNSDSFGPADAVAHGLRMVNPAKFASCSVQFYEFGFEFYKPVPQWLNSENWANPDRWNKDRW